MLLGQAGAKNGALLARPGDAHAAKRSYGHLYVQTDRPEMRPRPLLTLRTAPLHTQARSGCAVC